MRRLLALAPLLAGGCADVLGIEAWDASPGEASGGGSSSAVIAATSSGAGAGSPVGSAQAAGGGDGGAGATGGAGSTSTGETGGGGGEGCGEGASACGEACVDLERDPAHCGACDHGCFGGTCEAGRCGEVSLGAVTNPAVLAGAGTSIWVVDAPPGGGGQILEIDLAAGGSGATPALTPHVALDDGFMVTAGAGAADAFGVFFAGFEGDETLVLRYLAEASTIVPLGRVTSPLSLDVWGMAASGDHLWLAARLRDHAPEPDFGQGGIFSLDLGRAAEVPTARCVRPGTSAPASTGLAPSGAGVVHGRALFATQGPDVMACSPGSEALVSTTPLAEAPRDVVADGTHAYFTTLDEIYRVPLVGGPTAPEPWTTTATPAFLAEAGARVVWRAGNAIVHRRKDAQPGDPTETLSPSSTSRLTALGDVVVWVPIGTAELVLRRLPPP